MSFGTKAMISAEELYLVFLCKAATSTVYHLRGIFLDPARYSFDTETTVVRREKRLGFFFLSKSFSHFSVSGAVICFEYFHADLKTHLTVCRYVQVLYNL